MNSSPRFLISLLIYSAVIFVLLLLVQPHLPARAAFAGFYVIQLIVIGVTLAIHSGLTNAGKKSNQAFIRFFMGATAGRLFLYMVIMIIYGLLNRESAFGFILHFFVLYLVYTIFEVAFSYKQFSSVRLGQK